MTRYSSADDWVFAGKQAKWKGPIWGRSIMRKTNSSGCRKARNQQANKMEHLPTFLFDSAP